MMIKGKTAEKQRKSRETQTEKKAFLKGEKAICNTFGLLN